MTERVFEDTDIQRIADSQLHLFSGLPRLITYLSDVPLNDGKYWARCHVGSKDGKKWSVIEMKSDYYNKVPRVDIVQVIQHELIHAWLFWRGIPCGHNEAFNE